MSFNYTDSKTGVSYTIKNVTYVAELEPLLDLWHNEAGWTVSKENRTIEFANRLAEGVCFAAFEKNDQSRPSALLIGKLITVASTGQISASENGWFVERKSRGAGLGKILCRVFEAWAKSNFATSVSFSISDFGSNEKELAKAKLEKDGYEVIGYFMGKKL